MKLNKTFTLLIFLLSGLSSVKAQSTETYLFPITPGTKSYLAGTMGELRSSHFHAGIDIKTGGQEGLPVYATKRGYISRINISSSGYGNALYMLHPDGNTSVYAHLRDFDPRIEKYVKEAQYQQKTFEIELFPEPYEFAFKKGDEIAKSGNTGGSTGPHLHFEIRDEQQRVLNPLHYGFDEVKDNIAPIAQKLAIRPVGINARVEQRFQRKDFALTRNGRNYYIKDTISAYGKVGIELLGHDKLDGAANKNGISTIEVLVNGELYHTQNIDVMSFSLMRHILVHYPYDIKLKEGSSFHKLYVDKGNKLNFYESKNNDGYLHIEAHKTYNILVKMYDPYGNMSELAFNIKGEKPALTVNDRIDFQLERISYEIDKNILKVFTEVNCAEDEIPELSLYINDSIKTLHPQYFLDKVAVFLWDMNQGIPSSALSCEKGVNFPINERVIPLQKQTIIAENFSVDFQEYSLFDTIFTSTNYEIRTQDSLEIFSIEPISEPLKSNIHINLMPQFSHYNKEHTHVYQTDDAGNFSFVGGSWNNETINFSTRSLGEFTLLTDSIPPTITIREARYSFIIKDELSGIDSYSASLNGQWILLKYEPKLNLIWIEWPDDLKTKSGDFNLTLKDKAGNQSIYTSKF
ncbi:M23 family metallopeptidase [Marivirga sp. S37H4]|uniref:M23 family metallopeptidase n=1 Tax=Marivirga aurantiaca TaxID=2802615 RepID=A0A934WVW6_9BACT|nr:M23 family metallopeptidase [Marivirga aurantiaca]MBK6263901.1 M23 family metallopeptidase [Marivirga aurantiaca]